MPQRETLGPILARRETGPVSARDYLRKLKEPAESKETDGSHKYTAFLPELTKIPTEVIISMLKKSIIYDQGTQQQGKVNPKLNLESGGIQVES